MSRKVALWAPVVAYMGLIFFLSSRPVPEEAGRLLPDKVVHAGEYAGLCALVVRALAGGWPRPVSVGLVSLAIALTAAYGVSDEIHQSFVPARSMDVYDLVADATGATMAGGVLYAWGIIRARDAL